MGRRGPLPKAAYQADAQPNGTGVGEAPTWISDEAKRHYMFLAEILGTRLEAEDTYNLALAAQAMAEIAASNVMLAREGCTTEGPQGPVMHPAARFRALAHKEFQTASAKLGLSPGDRQRISSSLNVKEPTGPSDFQAEHGGDGA